jgi:hypothetical protein
MKTIFFLLTIGFILINPTFNTNATILYSFGSNTPLDCTGGLPDCSVKYPTANTRVYEVPYSQFQLLWPELNLTEFNFAME